MVFLMQYLDDELCNQICGLLINIHMEDRSKELEKKEMERSGLFKSSTKQSTPGGSNKSDPIAKLAGANGGAKKERSLDDLLSSDEDLGIEDNNTLEQYTLQKITMEWLNWNAQFFDYSDEPYLFYLAELLSNPLNSDNNAQMLYKGETKEMTQLMKMFKNMTFLMNEKESSQFFDKLSTSSALWDNYSLSSSQSQNLLMDIKKEKTQKNLDVYSPFRLLANFASQDYSLKDLNPSLKKGPPLFKKGGWNDKELLQMFQQTGQNGQNSNKTELLRSNSSQIKNILSNLSQKNFSENQTNSSQMEQSSEKALGQRRLRKEYTQDNLNLGISAFGENNRNQTKKASNYLDFSSYNDSYNEFRDYYRKQTEKAISEEEAKKVFVIINSFGGSVGNGITVHDALQFIKAGSLTLALGVAASAASLALAGGTIGERYVTEGCHVMIHQPEGGLQGQASDIWIDSQEIMKIRLDVAEIYSLSTYRPRHKILRDLDRDFYLTATETIYYGLADEIATNEVMHEIIEMTNKVWDYHDSKQQRLLETRESATSALESIEG
uniref:ATP-dependent Clp protease proteolytic subunit n=1 Tax=Chlamydomonas sp. ICE-L TaxID=309537 RepID=A0A345K4X1_9CHLO|nr:Clp protease proteolytic subunit [Chlamydomonas sp. ICE-L]